MKDIKDKSGWMDKVLDLFKAIFKLEFKKMVVVLLFIAVAMFLSYKFFLEKEKIEYVMKPLQDHSGQVMTNENGEEIKILLPEEK